MTGYVTMARLDLVVDDKIDNDFAVLYTELTHAQGKYEASFGGSNNIMVEGQEYDRWLKILRI